MSYNLPAIPLGKLAAAGHSNKLDNANAYDSLQFEIVATDTPTFSVRIKGSFNTDVDFTQPNSNTNKWFYVALRDYSAAGTVSAGATGLAITSAGTYAFEANCSRLMSACIEVFSHSAGTANITAYPTDINDGK